MLSAPRTWRSPVREGEHDTLDELRKRHWEQHEKTGTQLTIFLPPEIPGADAEEIEDSIVEFAHITTEPYPGDIFASSFKGEGCGYAGHPDI